MKVKVGNSVYDSDKEPIMVFLSKGERKQIANMHPEATKYCVYPATKKWTTNNYKKIKRWMEKDK